MTREEAITIIDKLHLIGCGHNQHEDDIKTNIAIDMAIEALSERTGEWICKGDDYAVCSECGGPSGTQFDGVEPIPKTTAFCPNCGVKMKGGENE